MRDDAPCEPGLDPDEREDAAPGWPEPSGRVAVLLSGGLDSAILLGEAIAYHDAVYPLYVRNGFAWEPAEEAHARRFLEEIRTPRLRSLHALDLPLGDLLPEHWATTGRDVPEAGTPDEAVYLPARNALLLAKALPWCALNGVPALALGVLESNPFADASPAFFAPFQAAMTVALGRQVRVERPFAELGKTEVMRLGQARGLPLERTFSCIRPVLGRHCGECNKCAERRQAFAQAGLVDRTDYARGH